MRDAIAAAIAFALLLLAASLATTLHFYRRRRQGVRDEEGARGRTIVAEIPTAEDLVLFSEDVECFYYGARSIDKDRIAAVRVLINGSPIASCVSERAAPHATEQATSFDDRPEGIARDRWDVAIESIAGTTALSAEQDLGIAGPGLMLVECGAIRERVSQELARAVFDAVKRELETRDATNARK